MTHRGSIVLRILGIVILFAVLAGAGALIFQAGQAQGYALGLAASGKELQAPAPGTPGQVLPFYPGYGPGFYPGFWRPHFFFPFGPLFGLLFFFVIFFVIGGIFRRRFWGYPGPYGHWHGGYPGPYPWGAPPEHKETRPEGQTQTPPETDQTGK